MTIRFEIEGEPMGKDRPRMSKQGHVYTPKATKDAEALVAESARYQNIGADMPLDGPVRIEMVFWSTHDGKKRQGRRDLDNLCKLVMDGLNRVAWHDDWQVSEIDAKLYRGSEQAGSLVLITQIAPAGANADG